MLLGYFFSSTLMDYSIEPLRMVCHVRGGLCTWNIKGERPNAP